MRHALLVPLVAVALAVSHAPVSAGSAIGGSLSVPSGGTATYGKGLGRPAVAAPTWTLTPQAGQPLGSFVYLNNGMAMPRSTNYFFTWQGRPCQTLNGSVFCQ
jgi:hypothetical protein